MFNSSTCCTCAKDAGGGLDLSDETKKSYPAEPRRLACCGRLICDACQRKNPRFKTYCPFCQISTEPSSLPQGLRDPPAYDDAIEHGSRKSTTAGPQGHARGPSAVQSLNDHAEPPSYDSVEVTSGEALGAGAGTQDVVHHLRPSDTLASLSVAYRVPAHVLKSHNAIFSESILPARRVMLIPASHYQGPSLSSEPLESEEERERKARLRRFMVASKCSDYNVAQLYLKQANDDVDAACRAWDADENWERQNPLNKGKAASSKLLRSQRAMSQRTR